MELTTDFSNFVYSENDIVFVYSGINNENAEHIELESSMCLSDTQLFHHNNNQFVEYNEPPELPKHSTFATTQMSNDIPPLKTDTLQQNIQPSNSSCAKNDVPNTSSAQIVICKMCNIVLTSENKLKRHIKQNHLYTKPHKCDQCSEEFNVISNLMLHSALHKSPFRCPQCGKIFKRLSSLEGHIRSHFKSEYFVCSHCGEMFHYEACIKDHMEKLHPLENYKLQEQRAAKAKARKLTKGKMLKCQFCDKEFKKNCLLQRHERIHKNERPYKCEYENCNSAFVQKNSLVIHTLKHSGARPHQCPKCPQSFTQKGNLVVHTLRCHSTAQDFPYPCTQCTCMFKKLGTLNAHISRCHSASPIPMTDGVCDNVEFEINNVMNQLAQIRHPVNPIVHLYDPTLSQSEFLEGAANDWSELPNSPFNVPQIDQPNNRTEDSTLEVAEHTSDGSINHRVVKQKLTENIRWLICIYCPKQFRRPSDLLRHIRIHTKEKPYQCPDVQCKRRFAIKSTLNVHMRVHEKNLHRHTCPTCLKTFSTSNTLDQHCTMDHPTVQAFNCAHCSAAFSTSNSFKSHYRKNHYVPVKKQSTPITVSQKTQLPPDDDLQIDVQMEEPIEIAPIAESVVKSKKSEGGPHKCHICDLSFRRNYTLKKHIDSHLGTKSYECQECKKSYSTSFILKRHQLLVHAKKRDFTCTICNCSFSTAEILSRHAIKHSDVRNFVCPYCQKGFKTKANCRHHMQVHKSDIIKHVKNQLVNGGIPEETANAIRTYPPPLTESNTFNDIINIDGTRTVKVTPAKDHIKYILLFNNDNVPQEEPTPQNISNQPIIQQQHTEPLQHHLPQISEDLVNLHETCISQPLYLGLDTDIAIELDEFELIDKSLPLMDVTVLPIVDPNLLVDEVIPMNVEFDIVATNHSNTNLLDNTYIHTESTETINFNLAEHNDNVGQVIVVVPEEKPAVSVGKQACQICTKAFKKPIDLRRHMRTHSGEKPFKCELCLKSFTLRCILMEHLKVHDAHKTKYPCHICRKSFTTKGSLRVHLRIHSNQKPYKCAFCELTFRTSGHQRRHEMVHIKEAKRLSVNPNDIQTKLSNSKLQPILDAINMASSNLQASGISSMECLEPQSEVYIEQIILDENDPTLNCYANNWCCNICDSSHANSEALHEHMKIHKPSPVIVCLTCNKTFRKQSLLLRHMVVHTKEKPYPCPLCNKSFAQKASMMAHAIVHNKKKPFACETCKKKFNFKTNFVRHLKTCGPREILYCT